ncbi:MAG: prephenate dehydrogenase [Bryobacteraceae bacterium]
MAIVGVGLIGGSFARALRSRAGFRGTILGVSRAEYASEAVAAGVIDEAVSLEEAAGRADFVYLSSSISKIIAALGQLDPYLRPGALVSDAGSTKSKIMEAGSRLKRGVFVGGHPMAGKETRGSSAADADLFSGKTYFLTFSKEADKSLEAVTELCDWLTAFGARIVPIRPDEHDRLVALTSHLAQVASTALALTLDRRLGAETARIGAGSGIVDMTRLAMSGYDGLWSDILATNRDSIAPALDFYISELQKIRRSLGEDLGDSFGTAGAFARTLRNPTE